MLFHAAAVLLLLAVYLFLRAGGMQTSQKVAEVLTLRAEEIDQISYTDKDGSAVHLARQDDAWVCADAQSMPLQQNFITNMLSRLSSLTAGSTIKVSREADAETYGLKDPSNVIRVHTVGADWEIQVGMRNMTTGDYYVSLGGEEIYLIDQTFVNLFATPVLTMLERETPPSPAFTDLRSLIVTDGDHKLAFSPDEDGKWMYQSGDAQLRPASASAVLTLFSNLIGVRFSEPASWEDLKKDESSPTAQDMQTGTGLAGQVWQADLVYDQDGEEIRWTLRLAEGKDGIWYVCSDGSAAVYQSDESTLSGLLAAFTDDYADYTVPYMGNQRVEKIDATIFDTEYHLAKSDGQAFNKLYYQLISLTADEIGTYEIPDSKTAEDGAAAEIVYTATDGETSTVLFYEYGQGELLAVADGEASWLVNKKKVLILNE